MTMQTKELRPEIRPAADCHFHIIDHACFPFPGDCGYTPRREESGTFEELSACFGAFGITHGVAVQPSGYGYDPAAMLDALARSGGSLKGIAMAPAGIGKAELRRLADAGVVGLRFNLTDFDPGGLSHQEGRRLLMRILELNWFAEVQCRADDFPLAASLIAESGMRLLIDHLGRPDPSRDVNQPGFQAILRMADTGRATVKLSGAFRESREPYPFRDMDPFVRALLAAYTPEHCIWGSDWPFINLTGKLHYRQAMSCLERWVPGEQDRGKILWETPAKLFGFKRE